MVQPTAEVSPSCTLATETKKIVLFMHILIWCTRNGHHLNFSIQTGKAHKERMMPQAIVNTFKKCEGGGTEILSKMMMAAKC